MAKEDLWIELPDHEIRHVWGQDCECSRDDVYVGPDFYDGNGTPVCGECGADLIYLKTEILLRDMLIKKE